MKFDLPKSKATRELAHLRNRGSRDTRNFHCCRRTVSARESRSMPCEAQNQLHSERNARPLREFNFAGTFPPSRIRQRKQPINGALDPVCINPGDRSARTHANSPSELEFETVCGGVRKGRGYRGSAIEQGANRKVAVSKTRIAGAERSARNARIAERQKPGASRLAQTARGSATLLRERSGPGRQIKVRTFRRARESSARSAAVAGTTCSSAEIEFTRDASARHAAAGIAYVDGKTRTSAK